jgi:uncharacterized membrane protein YfcA
MPGIGAILFSCLAILLAGIVRGYSGFGFSMIAVLSLSLFLPPVEVVPSILILEVAASFWLLPRVWRDVDWPSLTWILLGVLVGTPLGVHLLATVSALHMRISISLAVVVVVVLLLLGFGFKRMPGRPLMALIGLVTGVLNGGAAIGGPPAVIFYFSSPKAASVGRASLIALFLATDTIALGNCLVQGLIGANTALLTAIFLLPLVAGVTLGSRAFIKTDEKTFRLRILQLLLLLSAVSLVRALW